MTASHLLRGHIIYYTFSGAKVRIFVIPSARNNSVTREARPDDSGATILGLRDTRLTIRE